MSFSSIFIIILLAAASIGGCSAYQRPKAKGLFSVPVSNDADGLTPQQVHVSLVGSNQMRVAWLTHDDAPPTVDYGTASGHYSNSSTGTTSSYSFILYRSGKLHEAVIGPLHPSTVYYYRCGGNPSREFSFRTPPPSLPVKLAIIGDLGQTEWTKSTLQHLASADYDLLLLPGDLSYADFKQPLWDNFGRLVEPLASSRPWMVTEGNHEVERILHIGPRAFKAYNARWRMPYDASGSDSNLYYSFDVAGGAIHVLMLGSYTDSSTGSPQYQWLVSDLRKVDRSKTKWIFAVIHAPWYNSNDAHQGEGEDMRLALEAVLYGARVDAIFAGHVHAYERFARVYNNTADECGAVHITIGDGGNKEGLAKDYKDPQPVISLFREASFGHGRLEVANATHALWAWHRNDDNETVVTDHVWLTSLSSNPKCRI